MANLGGNIGAGILENLGKMMSAYGMGQIEQGQKMELAKQKATPSVLELALMNQMGISPQTQGQPTGQVPSIDASMPQVGSVVDGYKFLGGDPKDRNSWQQVR